MLKVNDLWWTCFESTQGYFFDFHHYHNINSWRSHRKRPSFPGCLKANMYLGFICFTVTWRGSSWDQNTALFFPQVFFTDTEKNKIRKKKQSLPLRVYSLTMRDKKGINALFLVEMLLRSEETTERLLGASARSTPGAPVDMPGHATTLPPRDSWG